MLPGLNYFLDIQKSSVDLPTATIDFNITGESYCSRYFDSGIVPGVNTTVETMMVKNSNPELNTGCQFGCRTGWISGAFGYNFGPSNGRTWSFWNTMDSDFTPVSWNYMIIRQESGGHIKIYDEIGDLLFSYDWNEDYTSYESNSYYIGDINENGSPKGGTDGQGSARIGWIKFYESDALIHNYRPSIENGSVCMTDLVTGNVLYSTGTAEESSIRYTSLKENG